MNLRKSLLLVGGGIIVIVGGLAVGYAGNKVVTLPAIASLHLIGRAENELVPTQKSAATTSGNALAVVASATTAPSSTPPPTPSTTEDVTSGSIPEAATDTPSPLPSSPPDTDTGRSSATDSEITRPTRQMPTATPISTRRNGGNNNPTAVSTSIPTLSRNPISGQTPTATVSTSTSLPAQTSTPTPTAVPSASATPTAVPASSSAAQPGQISGRVTVAGQPASEDTILILEDQSYNEVAQTMVGEDGRYRFANVPATSRGYNVLFVQELNESIYSLEQAISYGWMGPVVVANGATVELPDFEVSLMGFGQSSPEPNAVVSAASITAESPLTFEWSVYSPTASYWVDLVQGEEQDLVWQSSLVQTTSVSFDGTLSNGAHIQPGQYGWGVGARRVLDAHTLTVYGYVAGLTVEP